MEDLTGDKNDEQHTTNEQEDESLLVIVLDTNPSQRILRQDPHNFAQCVEAIVVLGNCHILQKPHNRLAVMACHHHGTELLYPAYDEEINIRQTDGQYEAFTIAEKTIKQRLLKFTNNAPKLAASCESLLAGAIGMALCYISKMQKLGPKYKNMLSRILVVTGSNECASQYMAFMNVFFTAQKMDVVIDVCILDKHLSLLQQGCDITDGQYVRITQLEGLLQYLLWIFLPDIKTREKLVRPPATKVDYRAACFCHRELIDTGFVCSVCLSIYCKFRPICNTCNTIYKLPPALLASTKKKKM